MPNGNCSPMLLVAVFTITLIFLMTIQYKQYRDMETVRTISRLDSMPIEKEWDPHRLGICVLSEHRDATYLRDTLHRARRVYPRAPVYALSKPKFTGKLDVEREFDARIEYVSEFDIDSIVQCLRFASNSTQIVALIDDRTWIYRVVPIIPEGLVGLVGEKLLLIETPCVSDNVRDPLHLFAPSILLSQWIQDRVEEELINRVRGMPYPMSQLLVCSNERLGVDHRLYVPDDSNTEEFNDVVFFIRNAH
jgi:hypothetical protein